MDRPTPFPDMKAGAHEPSNNVVFPRHSHRVLFTTTLPVSSILSQGHVYRRPHRLLHLADLPSGAPPL